MVIAEEQGWTQKSSKKSNDYYKIQEIKKMNDVLDEKAEVQVASKGHMVQR